jgi:hypothetical protein
MRDELMITSMMNDLLRSGLIMGNATAKPLMENYRALARRLYDNGWRKQGRHVYSVPDSQESA